MTILQLLACFRACIGTTSVTINCTGSCTLDHRCIVVWHLTTLELSAGFCDLGREHHTRGLNVGRPSFLDRTAPICTLSQCDWLAVLAQHLILYPAFALAWFNTRSVQEYGVGCDGTLH